MGPRLAVVWLVVLAGCSGATPVAVRVETGPSTAAPSSAAASGTPSPSETVAGPTIRLHGTFERWTDFPCHRSDPFVGGESVVFHGSDAVDTTIVTGSANWIGRPADSPVAPLGQCHQVSRFSAELPRARSYVVEMNDHRLPPVALAQIRDEGWRHRFVLP